MKLLNELKRLFGCVLLISIFIMLPGRSVNAYRYYDENGNIQETDTYEDNPYDHIDERIGRTELISTFETEAYSERIYPGKQWQKIPYDSSLGNVEVTTNVTYVYSEVANVAAAVNRFRKENGLEPLVVDENMTDTAMKRAATVHLFGSHGYPSEKEAEKYTCDRLIGGNLGCSDSGADANASAGMVESWYYQDPGHRTTVINSRATRMGIGVVKSTLTGAAIYCLRVALPEQIADPVDYVTSHKDYSEDYTVYIDANWFLGLAYEDEIRYLHDREYKQYGTKSQSDNKKWGYVCVDETLQFKPSIVNVAAQNMGNCWRWYKWANYGHCGYVNHDTCVYESSDTSIFTVDDMGKVTGVKAGTAKLRVYLKNYPKDVREYTIHVRENIDKAVFTYNPDIPLVKDESVERKVSDTMFDAEGRMYCYKRYDYYPEKISPIVTLDGKVLTEGVDYEVKINDGIWIRGIGDYYYGSCKIGYSDIKGLEEAIAKEEEASTHIFYYPELTSKKKATDNKTDNSKKNTGKKVVVNSSGAYKLAAPVVKKLTAGKKKLSIKLKGDVKWADGYEIQYSQNKKFSGKTTKNTQVYKGNKSYTVKKLKKGKTYYVRIRAYRNINSAGDKEVGKWSAKKKIKVK